jgi:hypothetical protein
LVYNISQIKETLMNHFIRCIAFKSQGGVKMKLKIGLILGLTISALYLSVNLVFSQGETTPTTSASEIQAAQELQWIWAEVVSLDLNNHQMTLKYLDYDTDTEKEMLLSVDDQTTYENVKSFSEIKPQDTLSIDYTTSAGGKNIAKNINVEKTEGIQLTPEEAVKTTPEIQAETASTPTDKDLKPVEVSPTEEQSPVSPTQE